MTGSGGASTAEGAPAAHLDPIPARFVGSRFRYSTLVLATVCSGLFASGLTITVLTTAVPFIQRDFHTTIAAITWVVSAPFLFRAIFVPAFGKLADRFGRRRTWLVGSAIAATAAFACGFAPTVGWLIAFRAIAAIAGAAVVPASLALVTVEYEAHERVKAYGWWSSVTSFSPLFGVVIGGLVVEAFGWRWIFYGQFPFAVVALLAGWFVLRESRGEKARFDGWGTAFSIVGLGLVILAINRGPLGTWGWGSVPLLACASVAIVALVVFVQVERRVPSPILLVDLFRRRAFTAGVVATFLGNFAYIGGFFITSLMLAQPHLWGWSAAHVSLAVAPRALSFGIMGPLAGYLAARYGGRRTATIGMVLIVGSMVMLAILTPGDPYLLILPGLVLSGIGLGLVSPPATAAATNEAAEEDLGAASAAVNLGGSFGSSMGIAVMQAVLLTVAVSAEDPGMGAFSAAFTAGAVCAGLGVFATLAFGPPNRATRRVWERLRVRR